MPKAGVGIKTIPVSVDCENIAAKSRGSKEQFK